MGETAEQWMDRICAELDDALGRKDDIGKPHQIVDEIIAVLEKKGFFVYREDYRKAYNILMDYWDSLPDDQKPEIDKQLKEVRL